MVLSVACVLRKLCQIVRGGFLWRPRVVMSITVSVASASKISVCVSSLIIGNYHGWADAPPHAPGLTYTRPIVIRQGEP